MTVKSKQLLDNLKNKLTPPLKQLTINLTTLATSAAVHLNVDNYKQMRLL